MFDNIGQKIKILAKVLCLIGIIVSIIAAIIMFSFVDTSSMASKDSIYMGIGLAFLLIGSLLAWGSSLFMYGFGELIDNVCDIKISICGDESELEDQEEVNAEN